jgi:hypothetical protein
VTALRRRLIQAAVAVALGSAVVLVTQWAYPIGHLAVHLGHPQYSRWVGETSAVYVSIDIRVQNVGVDPVRIDSQHFTLVDDRGNTYASDASTTFMAYHAAVTTVWPLHDLTGRLVFRLPPHRTAARLQFVTTTGEVVSIKLS